MPAITPLVGLVRKDLQVFFSDRRAVIMSFAVPIAIASFFGAIFSGPSQNIEPARVSVAIVDQDRSAISKGVVAGAQADKNLRVASPSAEEAREAVRLGKTSVAVVMPKGFGDAAGAAFFGGGEKPPVELLYDPSHVYEVAMVRGLLTQFIMESVSQEMLGGVSGRAFVEQRLPGIESSAMPEVRKQLMLQMLRSVQALYNEPVQSATAAGAASPARRGLTMPYTLREEAMTAGSKIAYNGYAHAFAGMGVQFLLFAAANLGIEMLLERQRGLWKRLRSAPVSRATLLLGKAVSGALIALMTLLVSFGFAMIVFRVRIEGSVIGFLGVALACSLMAATFGLLVAALGRTPATARGVTTFAVLLMVMLGGAWVPTFVFPAWLQQLTVVVPARWAVDGLDAMTWRGVGLTGAVVPILVMLGFAALFGLVAVSRFRWEEA